MSANKTVFHWSSGKDSALALYYLLNDSTYQTDHLVTSVNDHYERVTMHGTPLRLLEAQFESIGLKNSLIRLPLSPSMDVYEQEMEKSMTFLKEAGYSYAAFGDIFLEDLKTYREKEMKRLGFETVFPLWKKDTTSLIQNFVDLGFKAVIVCANDLLGADFLGRTIDMDLVRELPDEVDPCGENGEFHTFCYDGPIFRKTIDFSLGEKIKRSYPDPDGKGTVDFWFQELN